MPFKENFQAYAKVLIQQGINIQKDQDLVITGDVEMKDLVRILTKEAYEAGAHEVYVAYSDDQISLMKYLEAGDDVFTSAPAYISAALDYYQKRGAGFLNLVGSDPALLSKVEPKRIRDANLSRSQALEGFNDALMANKNTWLVAAYATPAWAQAVFPDKDPESAVSLLWEAIFKACRIDQDPLANWKTHLDTLQKRADFLNEAQFKTLHYTNSLGTDLKVDLPLNHFWASGADTSATGIDFIANIPTEEIFTAPQKDGVNGIVYATMPLNYGGSIIDDFHLVFEDGKVIEAKAEKGQEVLDDLLETDPGASYLGEVALVPYKSPISDLGILFYETLFDENASCHLALGQAYSSSIQGGDDMTKEEVQKRGLNSSLTHVDFMVGSSDLKITGLRQDGTSQDIFVDGNWAPGL